MNMKIILLKIYKGLIKRFTGYGLIKFYPIKVLYKFINSLLIPKYVFVGGHKMYLDAQDSLNLSIEDKTYKPLETDVLNRNIKKGFVVLDIGANIGDDTLEIARSVGAEGKVYAFEPDPDSFKLLKKNIRVNGYENVTLVNKAVSNRNGKIKLFISDNNKADHRIYDSKDNRKYVVVDMVSIDSFFKNKKEKVDFIKIDIQGAETLALKGMKNLLVASKKPPILSEFWPIGLKRCGSNAKEYLNFLSKVGYKFFLLDEGKSKILKAGEAELLKEFTEKKANFTNLLCLSKMDK